MHAPLSLNLRLKPRQNYPKTCRVQVHCWIQPTPKKLESSFLTQHENSTNTHKARYSNPENLAPANTSVNFELGERGSEIPPQVIQPPNI